MAAPAEMNAPAPAGAGTASLIARSRRDARADIVIAIDCLNAAAGSLPAGLG